MIFVTRMFGIAIIAVLVSGVVKKNNPAISSIIMLAASIGIIFSAISLLVVVIDLLNDITSAANIGGEYIKAMLQITGITILLKLLLAFLDDIGGESLKFAVELGGRLCILLIALPYVFQAITVLKELLVS